MHSLASRTQSGLEIVASFVYPHEADVAKSLLDAEGIESWLLDDEQIRMRWHLSAALGGVKLAVTSADMDRARELLAEDRSSLLEGIPENELPPADQEICPHCGGGSVAETRSSAGASPLQWGQALLFLASLGLLVPRRRTRIERRCPDCNRSWSAIESG